MVNIQVRKQNVNEKCHLFLIFASGINFNVMFSYEFNSTTVSSLMIKMFSVIQGFDLCKLLYGYFSQKQHDTVEELNTIFS